MQRALHPPLGALFLLLSSLLSGQTIQLSPADLLRAPLGSGSPSLLPAQTAQAGGEKPAATPEKDAGAVAQGYLYIEPYQTRFEYLMDAPRLLRWLNPGEEPPEHLPPQAQKDATRALQKQVEGWCKLGLGTTRVPGGLTSLTVVLGRPGDTRPPPEGESVPTREAMFGCMWEFATPPSPEEVFVEWGGFIADVRTLPVRIFFGTGSEAHEIHAALPRLAWKSEGRVPLPIPLAPVPELESRPPTRLPLATLLWLAGTSSLMLLLKKGGRPLPGGALAWTATLLAGALLSWPLLNVRVGGGTDVPEIQETQQAEAILTPLLRNVYRAFDRRTEEQIYDVLARSVDGELLRRLYLETLEALTLDGREGARVTISEFSLDVLSVRPVEIGTGFTAECQWTALGKVGHWGHTHPRVNRYNAKVTVSPVQGEWKLTGLEVTEARRI